MTATLVATDVTVVRGASVVLDHVSLTVAPGDRIGVVGPNGVGKSTLLGALAGLIPLDAGRITLAPPEAQVGLLPQEPDRRAGESLLDLLARRTGVQAAQAALDAATEGLAAGDAAAAEAYDGVLQRWLDLGGADLDSRAEEVCADLGLDVDLAIEMRALSGGQAARASLASVLLSRFAITFLDEPTNDLDFDGLRRLEAFAAGVSGALVVVSHDREFLERTVTSVVEVDQHYHGINEYTGSYSSYLEQRALARQQARDSFEEFDDQRQALVEQAQRQREQSVRGAIRAQRRSKDNDKSIKGFRVESATHAASRVRNIENRLNRLEEVAEPRKEWQLQLSIAQAPRSGDDVVALTGAVVRLGGYTLGPVDLAVHYGDRISITGPNGAGKSTLIAALFGDIPLDEGTQRTGSGVVRGGIDQARNAFRGDRNPLDLAVEATDWPAQEVRTLWAKFGLTGDQLLRPASALSPGERTRSGLALLQAVGVNCLVLDEPTNHLDLVAIEQLELALDAYTGTLLVVTHDRQLLEAVRFTRSIHVDAGKVT